MFPLKYVKNALIYILKYNGFEDLTFLRNCEVLIKQNQIDSSSTVGLLFKNLIEEMITNRKNIEEAISSIIAINFEMDEFIDILKNEELNVDEIPQIKSIINETIAVGNITKNVKIIQDLSTKIINKELNSATDIKKNFQQIMVQFIDVLVKLDNKTAEDQITISSDTIDQVLERLQQYYETDRIILPTSLELFDKYLNGGLHSSRLYTFAIKSGDGKSTVMLSLAQKIQKTVYQGTSVYNMIINKMKKQDSYVELKPTIYYFTFENSINESLERYIPGIIDEPIESTKDLQNKKELIKDKIQQFDIQLDIVYRGGFTTSPIDIIQYVEKEKVKGKIPIAFFIDYLGIMISDSQRVEKRLQLEEITAGLKNISVMYDAPVVTGVQVKKDSFDKSGLTLSDIKESSGIIDNSDVILAGWQGEYLPNYSESCKEMFFRIEKQRNFIKGVEFRVGVDFSIFSLFNLDQSTSNFSTNSIKPQSDNNNNTGIGSLL